MFDKDYVFFDWFMTNCKDSRLYCRYFNVTKEELQSLLTKCRFEINNPSVAKKLFPNPCFLRFPKDVFYYVDFF